MLVAELSLIDIQQWRGVGSHFNSATPLDGAIFTTMGVLIMIAAVVMAFWTRAIFKPLPAARGTLLSARAGMVLLNLGNVMGVFIAVWGATQLAAGIATQHLRCRGSTQGAARRGVACDPGPAADRLAGQPRSPPTSTVARLATAGYAGLFAFTLLQTFSGRAPHDITIGTALLLAVSILLMGWAAVTATDLQGATILAICSLDGTPHGNCVRTGHPRSGRRRRTSPPRFARRSSPPACAFRSPSSPIPPTASVLFVVEQGGLIRVVRDGVALPTPFLDLRSVISTGGERGLLGMALAPDFADSRRFFVNFTNRSGDTVVARFRRTRGRSAARRPELALRSAVARRTPLHRSAVRQSQRRPPAVRPDGYLYIGMGDGGSGGDPMNHAQNPQSLLGKMLRIDVAVPDDDPRGYRVPEDNPFVDGEPIAALAEIWAFGLAQSVALQLRRLDARRHLRARRSPTSVRTRARRSTSSRPGAGGRNYGWRLREGRQPYDARTPAGVSAADRADSRLRAQHRRIDHRRPDLSRRGARSALQRPLFLRRLRQRPRVLDRPCTCDPLPARRPPTTSGSTPQRWAEATLGMVSSFGVDHDGELLLLNYSAGRSRSQSCQT